MTKLEKDILLPPQLARAVAEQLSLMVDASYKNLASASCRFPLYAGEAELESAANEALQLQASADVLRGVMHAFLKARREQSDEMEAEQEDVQL